MDKRYSAVLVAAGQSSRMGGGSKIFTKIKEKTVIEKTTAAFAAAESIADIVVVCRAEDKEQLAALLCTYPKPILFVSGGATRQQSVLNGIAAVQDSDYFVIHDAARPMIMPEMIDKLCCDAAVFGASAAAVWAKDTCKLVDENGFVTETPPRDRLMMVQTPQVFACDLYCKAAEKAAEAGLDFTDDCQLIEFSGGRVHLVESDYRNIKITTPEDLSIVKAFEQFE